MIMFTALFNADMKAQMNVLIIMTLAAILENTEIKIQTACLRSFSGFTCLI